MNKFILGLMAISLLAFTACDTVEVPEDTSEITFVEEETTTYSFDLPEDYSLHTTDYDNYVPGDGDTVSNWYGPESDFWTDGFYLRISDSSAYEFLKNAALNSPLAHPELNPQGTLRGEGTETINGVEMQTMLVYAEIGYTIKYYFFEVDERHYEFQLLAGNETAQNTIESFQLL